MKQSQIYQTNQSSLLRQWQLQSSHQKHITRLNTIYRPRNKITSHYLQAPSHHYDHMMTQMRNKQIDSNRKMKMKQEKIREENQRIRSKLIEASMFGNQIYRKQNSSYIEGKGNNEGRNNENQGERTHMRGFSSSDNYLKKQEKAKLNTQNAKLFVKLATIKSDLMTRLNIKDHMKKNQELRDKLEKKSPKKVKMLRSFFKKRNLDLQHPSMPTGHKSVMRNHSVDNEEDEYVVIL